MDENNKAVVLPCDACSRENQQELLARIDALAREYRGREGALIQVLHMAQSIYGYLPLEVQRVVADGLEIPLAEVSGVVTFYSFFSTQRRGKHTIRVCLGTACYVRGGKRIVERLQELLKVGVGLPLFLVLKSLLKPPLRSLLGVEWGDGLRYFILVLAAGIVYPLCFRLLKRIRRN